MEQMRLSKVKKFVQTSGWIVVGAALIWAAAWYEEYAHSAWKTLKNPEVVAQLKRLVAMKAAQAKAAPGGSAPEIDDLFRYAGRGDWLTLSNAYWRLGERFNLVPVPEPTFLDRVWMTATDYVSAALEKAGVKTGAAEEPGVRGTPWEAATEVWGAFNSFVAGDEKYSTMFGREIMEAIPAGSIYFGGTDAGRFIVTAMSKSQLDGDPFFTMGQRVLQDGSYRDYISRMYGGRIFVPTDAEQCLRDFQAEVETNRSVSPGIFLIANGLAKKVFDNNPGRQFFVDEGYPMEWMCPLLEPDGLIFKLNRQPVGKLSDDVLQRDHDFWARQIRPMIGGWVNERTTIQEIAAYAEKTYLRQDLAGFTGDPRFVQSAYASGMFSQ